MINFILFLDRVPLPSVGRFLRGTVVWNFRSISSTSSVRSSEMAGTSVLTAGRSRSSSRSPSIWTNPAVWQASRKSTTNHSKGQYSPIQKQCGYFIGVSVACQKMVNLRLFDSLDSFSEFLEPRWVFIPTRTRITPRGTKIHQRTKWQLLRKLRTRPYQLVKSVFSCKIIVHEHGVSEKNFSIWCFFRTKLFALLGTLLYFGFKSFNYLIVLVISS